MDQARAAEEGANVLIPDRAEARVRYVPSHGGRDAGIQAAKALRLPDIHCHATETELGAREAGLRMDRERGARTGGR